MTTAQRIDKAATQRFYFPKRNVLVLVMFFFFGAGCVSTGAEEDGSRTPRRVEEMRSERGGAAGFSTTSSTAQTIQFHREGDETSVPILQLSNTEQLRLEFDIIEDQGRPLSVYFYHADRNWRRDLSPSEYLESFQRDDILDYRPSRGTETNFVHYSYAFPNESIQFLISGNYIVRVSEQGDEDRVLFERPFFISEQRTPVNMALESVILPGFASTGVQPFAVFTPPSNTQATPFNYSVCFARNGAIDGLRCTDQASLMNQPALEFYLTPANVFEPTASSYFLDLTSLRLSNRIEGIDRSVSPFELDLEPDLGRLGAAGFGPLLNGQIVVSQASHDVADPDLAGQYVNVNFRFVPEGGRRYGSDLFVVGSFNNWQLEQSSKLIWIPERTRYEGSVLIKQGQYDYEYMTTSEAVNRQLRNGVPRLENTYTAFVYFDDISLQTDRLISVGGTTR
ncbi:MAG: DUF5103 domain-containing protein [Rhodothermales bacterium]|nr:DUF5103 domain-containing protein [Rhodothermales bacterium]